MMGDESAGPAAGPTPPPPETVAWRRVQRSGVRRTSWVTGDELAEQREQHRKACEYGHRPADDTLILAALRVAGRGKRNQAALDREIHVIESSWYRRTRPAPPKNGLT